MVDHAKDKMVIVQLDKTRPRTAVTTRRKRTNLMRGQKRGDKHWTERQIAQSRFERAEDRRQRTNIRLGRSQLGQEDKVNCYKRGGTPQRGKETTYEPNKFKSLH